MSKGRTQTRAERKRIPRNPARRIAYRLRGRVWEDRSQPMMAASRIRDELSENGRELSEGGIGAMHQLARRVGLVERINEKVTVLKRHLPYFESDHVLNIAHNIFFRSRVEHRVLHHLWRDVHRRPRAAPE